MKPSVSPYLSDAPRASKLTPNVDIYNDHKHALIRERVVDAAQELDDNAHK